MVLLELQKQHLALPFQFLLIRLSFVSVTPFFKNQRKVLIFSGTFIFQDLQNARVVSLVIRFEYMDFTVNKPFLFGNQTKASFSLVKATSATLLTSCSHWVNLLPNKDLLKETLRGLELSTLATVIFFFF